MGRVRKLNAKFSQLGTSDSSRSFDGRRYDKYRPELSGRAGYRTFEEMAEDPVLGGIILAVEMLIRNVKFWSEPAGSEKKFVKAAEFLEECREDMADTWEDMLTDILTMLVQGWSAHEIVYKYRRGDTDDPSTRSLYDDNRIGWRNIAHLPQDTLARWEWESGGDGISAFVQTQASQEVPIPSEKLLLFRTRSNRRNPEGQSILKKAYRGWYLKRRLEEIEGIGVERELAGLPVMQSPDGLDIWDDDDADMVAVREEAQNLIRDVRENQAEGVLMPFGWEFKLASSGGQRSIDVSRVIERYDRRNATTTLGDFILLGHESVGSFALADNKTNLFAVAIGAWLDTIVAVFNRYAIPRLFKFNQTFPQDRLPTLMHGDTEMPDLVELGDFITKTTGAGVLIPGPEIEDYVRGVAGLPKKPEADKRIDEEVHQIVQEQKVEDELRRKEQKEQGIEDQAIAAANGQQPQVNAQKPKPEQQV